MANTKESVKKLIAKVLEVSLEVVEDELAVGDIPEWDSLAHMRIIAALESDLGVVLDIEQTLEIEDVEDIIDAVLNNE
ncbi:acyl carrier protein [Vibrio sp. 99-8-1]|uniref:acyl carrier protein n=1 Tax=Vibrio sp. 99-8-1 TaxID=2607602 RepID=UPI0014939B19|nr:acyl carrier protein [Vibrio sp. 99-8-1]NOI66954.1 acyl carrier protein [Vibrio sp. 99-8-1]